jgi:hypothetical protein
MEENMKKNIALLISALFAFMTGYAANIPEIHSQPSNPREAGMAFYAKARRLKSNIQRGWEPRDVVRIMGQPEERRMSSRGNDLVEIWGYDSFDVRIVFTNGVVTNWNFRFMR